MQFSPKVDIDALKKIPMHLVSQATFRAALSIRDLVPSFQSQDPTFDTAPALKVVNDYFSQTNLRLPLSFCY